LVCARSGCCVIRRGAGTSTRVEGACPRAVSLLEMDRQLDLSLLASVAAAAVGVVAGGAEWLRSIVNPEPRPGVLMLALCLVVLLLTGVALSLVLAVVARLIASAGGFQAGFWPVAGLFLQDLALWLTIWILLWGVPFGVAMLLTGYLSEFFIPVMALSGGIIIGIAVLRGFRRYFARDIWLVLARFWPARHVGAFWMVVGITALTFPGMMLLQRCYLFEVSGAAGTHGRTETLPISVKVSGRLIAHDRLRGQLASVSDRSQPLRTFRFNTEESGTYLAWLNLAQVPPGFYRLRIYFDTSNLKGFDSSLATSPLFRPIERHILLQVTK
jgi:hypothetical protein